MDGDRHQAAEASTRCAFGKGKEKVAAAVQYWTNHSVGQNLTQLRGGNLGLISRSWQDCVGSRTFPG